MADKKMISGMIMDKERSLGGLTDAQVELCTFAGPAEGEYVLRDSSRVGPRVPHPRL